ncbi:MAG TPA: ABC transporter permease, partial [Gemmatimonadales bacterium]|nr:ABC transporter permease [Gemmatimonadales bacterium]
MLSELWSDIRYRMRALFGRASMERDLDQEVEYHLQRETERHVRSGLSPRAARLRAQAEFGGVDQIKESSRDGRGLALLDSILQDLRYAFRTLGRSPGFTGAVILTLGLGIGANVAMFGVVDRLLFRPPPFLIDPGAVNRVYLTTGFGGHDNTSPWTEYTRYLDLQRATHVFSQTAGFSQQTLPIVNGSDAQERSVQAVSSSYFAFFNAAPQMGRFFTSSEDTIPTGAHVVVISDGYWRRELGARRDVLGQTIRVGTAPYTIIGVAAAGFIGMPEDAPPAAFIPLTTFAADGKFGAPGDWYTRYNFTWMKMMVRRKPGITVEQASADLTDAFRLSFENFLAGTAARWTMAQARPRAMAGSVWSERGPNPDAMTKVAAWTGGVTLIVLLIACANVANLLLARSLRRRREIAVRLALGVGRARLARQLLTEALVLGLLGGVAGLLAAHWTGSILQSLFLPAGTETVPLLDPRTLIFAAAAVLVAGGLSALAPILQVRRPDLIEALKAGAREGTFRRSRLRTALLLSQGALSLVLLIGAGLFVKSLKKVEAVRLGFDVDPVLIVDPNLRGTDLTAQEKIGLIERLRQRAAALPGVEVVGRGISVPFRNLMIGDFKVPGVDSASKLGHFTSQAASPEYF